MPDQDTEPETGPENGQEPSIEEILTSIRQIIADDDEGDADAPAEDGSAGDAAAAGPESGAGSEPVIELTEKIDDQPTPEEVAPDPESAPAPEPESEPEPESAPEPEPISVEMHDSPPPAAPTDDPDALLTDNAEDAAFNAFSELARKTAIEHNGITVEEIVRTELRPLLKDWLDTNLPPIIERLVQEELERVAKRALED